ncbi:MAG: DUF4437 domain-containing protein [Streptosporangiaceae bacterium]
MWNRADVDFIQSQDVPSVWAEEGAFGSGAGGSRRLLSRDPAHGAETAIYRVATRQSGVLASDLDIYVLQGEAVLNGEILRAGGYAYVPAGARLDLSPSVVGLSLYCGFWGPPTWQAVPGTGTGAGLQLTTVQPETLSWTPAAWGGGTKLEPGAMTKLLRDDDRAFIYLAAMLPGWHCDMAEAHPVYEESFKVYGDTLMGSRGVMRPGAYFFRSPDVFHGPLYSRAGTMSFIRSDGRTSTQYREPEPGCTWQELSHRAYGGGGDPHSGATARVAQ